MRTLRLQDPEGNWAMTNKETTANITWRILDSITALPSGFWNEHVAGNAVVRCDQHIAIMERGMPEDEFLCLVAYRDDKIVGCAYFTLAEADRSERLSAPAVGVVRTIRKVFPRFFLWRVVAAGNDSTDGEHWWYDPDYWTRYWHTADAWDERIEEFNYRTGLMK